MMHNHTLIVNVNKPRGVTSLEIVRAMKRLTHHKKAGHLGTLDPLATGVLPVFLDKGTKLISLFEGVEKTYRTTMKLGITTDTFDADGTTVEEKEVGNISHHQVRETILSFQGRQNQYAPIYSALKINGVPSYQLAREGKKVERKLREITIHSITLEHMQLPYVTIQVHCTKGTYIRTLVHDIGQKLSVGAHVVQLERIKCGKEFTIDNAHTLLEIESCMKKRQSPFIKPIDILSDLNTLYIDVAQQEKLSFGQSIQINPEALTTQTHGGTLTKALNSQAQLVAIGKMVQVAQTVDFKPSKIFI